MLKILHKIVLFRLPIMTTPGATPPPPPPPRPLCLPFNVAANHSFPPRALPKLHHESPPNISTISTPNPLKRAIKYTKSQQAPCLCPQAMSTTLPALTTAMNARAARRRLLPSNSSYTMTQRRPKILLSLSRGGPSTTQQRMTQKRWVDEACLSHYTRNELADHPVIAHTDILQQTHTVHPSNPTTHPPTHPHGLNTPPLFCPVLPPPPPAKADTSTTL